MSDVFLSIDRTPEGYIQVSIDSDGTGYRLFGPSYDGRSKNIGRHKITERDAAEIRSRLSCIT